MNPQKIFKRLTPLVIAAVLLSFAAPASDAQRRRTHTRARAAQRVRRNTPRTTAPAQARPAPTPAPVSTQTQASGARPVNPDGAAAPRAIDETGADEQRSPQDERTFEEMIGADTYGAYVEVRRLGTLAQANELKTAIAGLKLFGDADTKPVTDLIEFISANHEPLAEARFVMVFMAARARVPVAVGALEFPSARDAAAFEPKYRMFADEQLKVYRSKYERPKDSTGRSTSRRGARERQRPETKPAQFDYTLRRVGRVLISSEKGLSLKRIRGEESAPSLADTPRFQNARTRFFTDSLFVYVDTGVTMQGWTRQVAEVGGVDGSAGRVAVATTGETVATDVAVVAPPDAPPLEVATAPVEAATPESDGGEGDEDGELTEEERKARDAAIAAMAAEAEAANKPSEEQRAVAGMGSVMRGLWGGMPRIPGAFALGARLDNGAVVVRLAVENTNDGRVSLIPFLPNLVAGPPVTAAAAEVAPADADIFFTTSLDWEQVYTSTIGSASLNNALSASAMAVSDGDEGEARQPRPEEAVAAIEKLFGFKFKEDLIPALGNEIAVSTPFDSNDLFGGRSYRRAPKNEEEEKEKDSEPGTVVIVSLNDPEKIRKILPSVLVALGLVSFGDRSSQAERRAGYDITSSGGFVYSILDRFLVVGSSVGAVRHVVDSYSARRTLAFADSYRDATGWQAPQKLVQAFVSEALMRSAVEETKRRSGDSIDPLVQTLLAQLEAKPESASFETTNEGDSVIHEIRVPVSMIQTYAISVAVNVRDAPVLSGESSATYALYSIRDAEITYKEEKKKGRYGTLEELIAEKIIDKGVDDHLGYQIELNAYGEKFFVTATPKEYGKTGRLSFFLDETNTIRAADHKGKPATASDPPVD